MIRHTVVVALLATIALMGCSLTEKSPSEASQDIADAAAVGSAAAAAGASAVEESAAQGDSKDTQIGKGVAETVTAVAPVLPFPWNLIIGAAGSTATLILKGGKE